MMKLLHILSVKMYQIELPEGKMPLSLCGNSVKEKRKKKAVPSVCFAVASSFSFTTAP